MIAAYIAAAVFTAVFLWILFDVVKALRQKPINDLPEEFLDPAGLSLVYYYLTEPENIPAGLIVDAEYIRKSLAPSVQYIEGRYDCADFRMQLLFRLYKDCGDKLPEDVKALIKKTCLNFRYWMDEPGEDSMCFWSENHQLLFAVSEYLSGQEWPDEVFQNDKKTGAEHKKRAQKRIEIWMEQRFRYGFQEWLSNNYYAENFAPMANFIEYADDKQMIEKMKIVFDLLWFDIASHSVNNTLVAVSSRMYGDNKSSHLYGNRIRAAMDAIWGTADMSKLVTARSPLEKEIVSGKKDMDTTVKLVGVDAQMMQNFIAMYQKGLYKLPEVIYDIANDKTPQVIKCSSGLNVSEYKERDLIGQNDNQIMMQLGGEAFTNPEIIANTYKYLNRTKMFRNLFVNPFRYFNIGFLRMLRIPKAVSKLNLMTNGIALGRGNLYCYRTAHYTLTTAMALNVDGCGAQAHIWTANIAPDLAVYTTHPSRDDEGEEKHGSSPGYWVGNGRQPMSAQHKNVNITIYKMPVKKRLLEFRIAQITHAFMPKEKFDRFEQGENYVIASRGKVLFAMFGNRPMAYRPYDEYAASLLIQHDKLVSKIPELNYQAEFDLVMEGSGYHAYITELSDTEKETYEEFKARVLNNQKTFGEGRVTYQTGNDLIEVGYDKSFAVNGEKQPLEYKRYESVYSDTEREPETIEISYGNKNLTLDYKNILRKFS